MWERPEDVNLNESALAEEFLKYRTEFDCLVAGTSSCACVRAPASCYDLIGIIQCNLEVSTRLTVRRTQSCEDRT